ncbi:protein FAM47B-like [Coregonus clupeaformis]|uniref:protein FAM47B-like n=1 Tax=Coregonus clupeaformis TaxID=59861 RepID=UPI001BE02F65|nr:protein FAM47B-like [Coregonus clupeaformis]
MVLPFLILLLLTLWMDGQFQRVLRMTCRCKCNLWGILLAILIKAVTIGLMWVVSVLLDGDWYVCYQRTELPCKNNTDDTPYQEELEKQLESRFKRESVVYGLVLVLVLLFVTSILTAIPWRDICSILCSKCKCMTDCKIKPYHRALFEENIREQTEILIEKVFKTTAKECVVLKSRKLLQTFSTAVLSDTTTQGGGGASSSSTHPEEEDSSSSNTHPEVEDSRSSTTLLEVEDSSSSNTHPEVEDSSCSNTHPEVEDSSSSNTHPEVEDSRSSTTLLEVEDSSSSNTHPEVEDSSSSNTHPEVEDSSSSTTHPEVEDSRSSTTRPEVEDSRSSTTRLEVKDRVITFDNLGFVEIADLHSHIISSLFLESSKEQTNSRNDNQRSGQMPLPEEGPQP